MIISFLFPEGRKKALTFSYDDGNQCDRRLADIFTAAGMKGTFNIPSGWNKCDGKLHADDLKQLVAEGHEVACHGKYHPFEDQLVRGSLLEDIIEDRRVLEEATGGIVAGMAYPFGTFNQRVFDVLRAAGIKYCRTVCNAKRMQYLPENWLEWDPTCHHREDIVEKGEAFLKNPWGIQLMYVWGHAFEFENNKNWYVMEQFCDRMKNLPEIWYATNMEIHDYIEACRAVETSLDTTIIHNPSAIPVWLSCDGTPRRIDGGATLILK